MATSSQVISSSANPLLKDVRRAVSAGTLTSQGFWVAESFHLLREAVRSGLEFKAVLASASARQVVDDELRDHKGVPVRTVEHRILQRISSTETTQGVISLVRPPVWKIDEVFRSCAFVVAIDGVQDPGNAGAIVRATEAFGATGVIFLLRSASPFHPKTLRASAGSLFRLPFIYGIDPESAKVEFQRRRVKIFAASPWAELPLERCDLTGPCGLIIGSEAHGVSETFRESARGLRIPTTHVESLNASVAAAVILYEASRQRASGVGAGSSAEEP